ncbi:succinylglutamate desuccinylase/aspartoacylase family protein [Tolypothrix sp. FACHB-123]|uniref:succinylglutamate desuccinylase/aspartoacylase family protein n=1 Tax=Tolypothrix sp. FACHB-123 TaxID=2692868 RepID=UPI00168475F9|nr:succinylglutamate desuccinylase/aspartoacylase family protein [Tolypothrix sp. FACHB-123]MBD2353171.1 succinylglutamate desuccinylase/aspartoacylase family protein [Tolypothrix sp. FACHB-123]
MQPIIETISLRQMASGDRLFLQVYKFIGAHPGKKVYIQSNLHGAEIAGNAAIHQLIEFLLTINDTDLAGEIWLVPVCNPMGVNERSHHFSPGRYCVYEAKDWNRIFWDYEKEADDLVAFTKSQLQLNREVVRLNYLTTIKEKFAKILEKINSPVGLAYTEQFAYKLQSLSIDADYLIDLHSSTNQAIDYLYYFRNREDSAKYFLLDWGILLDPYDGDAFDEAFIKPWLALEACFEKLGRNIRFDIEAWTLELGSGMQINPDSVNKAILGIKNYLAHKGVLQIPEFPKEQTSDRQMTFSATSKIIKYYAIAGGMIQSRVAVGSKVKRQDKLYQILSFNKASQLPQTIDIFAEHDGLVYEISTNQAVNQGELVLRIMQ